VGDEDVEFFLEMTELLGLDCVDQEEFNRVSLTENLDLYVQRLKLLCSKGLYDQVRNVRALKRCDPEEVCNAVLGAREKFGWLFE
jgi:hypothetical protein